MPFDFVPSGLAALAVEESGSGDAIVLLHAGVADRRSWDAMLEALELPVRTIRYDRRGFGDTVFEAEEFSHVDDLAAVLDNRDVSAAILIGNSQGGRIAIDFALTHPHRVRALVLIGTALSGAGWPKTVAPEVDRLAKAIAAAEADNDGDLVIELEAHLWLDGPMSEAGRVGGAARELFLEMNATALAAMEPGEERTPPSAVELLGAIGVPVLVLVGELDLPNVLERSEMIASQIPNAELVVLPNCAHLPQLEVPGVVAAQIRRFLLGSGTVANA
jgi:pimeloyl-ACP methyl ester carboxylesterase